jgi:biopolymer transport protein ExbD
MRRRSGYRGFSEINITSLVDIALCLLIIFMLTAPYIQGGVEVNLPQAETREVIVEEGPIITVTKERALHFDDDPIAMSDLAARLGVFADKRATLPVYLRADEDVPYGFVLRVMAAIEKEGFTNLSLVADQDLGERTRP